MGTGGGGGRGMICVRFKGSEGKTFLKEMIGNTRWKEHAGVEHDGS